MYPEKPNAGKLVQELFEGFIYYAKYLKTSRAPVVVCPTEKFTTVVPYDLETENMVDSNPSGITKYEPFLAHWNPQRSSSSLCVSPSSPTQPLRSTGCPCVTLKASTLPLCHLLHGLSVSLAGLRPSY